MGGTLRSLILVLAAFACAAVWTLAPPTAVAAPGANALTLETLSIEGNARTSRDVVQQHFPLHEGDTVDPDKVLDAVDELRAAELFEKVDFRAEAGSARGKVKLVLVVVEKRVELRFGTGYQDLDGWYLVPAELRFDNRLGRGERLRLTTKIGYRVAGAELTFAQPAGGRNGRLFWGFDLGGFGIDRLYFVDGVEYRHHLGRGTLGAHIGRRFGSAWRVEFGGTAETIRADSSASAYQDDPALGVSRGDELPFSSLPAGIQAGVGKRQGQTIHSEIVCDTRSASLVAGTPDHGFWGRVRAESFFRESTHANALTADLRGYQRVADLGLALRVKGGVIGEDALFYDRFYLGGLYTVRGFPSQSLSPAEGSTRFWTATLEARGPLVGSVERPRLAGVAFVDFGEGWTGNDMPRLDDAAASFGFGLRLRVPWFEWVGLDFGIPLTETPVRESFHANGALGWNF